MSIATKTGDKGTTGLMYNRRVSKADPRVEAYGCVDELNAALGMARATAEQEPVRQNLLAVQKILVILMGELATAIEDRERYFKDGFIFVASSHTAPLDVWIKQIESQNVSFRNWATPGASIHSAALDLARTVCRRAERRVCSLVEIGEVRNPEIAVYLNRLSDWLWLLARAVEPPDPSNSPNTVV